MLAILRFREKKNINSNNGYNKNAGNLCYFLSDDNFNEGYFSYDNQCHHVIIVFEDHYLIDNETKLMVQITYLC